MNGLVFLKTQIKTYKMNIEQQLELLESLAEGDIKKLQPKDRLAYYNSLKEYTRAKIQRATFEPVGSGETEIIIKYESNKTTPHKNISKSLDKPKKN